MCANFHHNRTKNKDFLFLGYGPLKKTYLIKKNLHAYGIMSYFALNVKVISVKDVSFQMNETANRIAYPLRG